MDILQIDNLYFSYPMQKKESLQGIHLQIEEGKFYILCGKSGSGKSTLLRQLKTELTPCGSRQGEIRYQGKLLEEVPAIVQGSEIGYVFQNPDAQLVTDKVWHELAFGLESIGCDNETIHLRVAEMASYFGMQNWFHKEVAELSGGQKQLLNLASVMAMHPKVLLLDEPTSQLDPIAAAEFLDTIHRINTELGITVLLAEHHLEDAVGWADSVIVMEEGQIIAQAEKTQIGQMLRKRNPDMFLAMPAPMRIYAATESTKPCPYNVALGRQWLAGELEELQQSWQIARKMLKKNPKAERTGDSREMVLKLKDVWFRYERDLPDVVRGLSLEIKRGEIFAMMGGNGTGKSTVLRLMAGLLHANRGIICLQGKKLSDYSVQELHHGFLGVLPQDPTSLFVKKTVKEDLYQILEEKDRGVSDRVAEKTGKEAGAFSVAGIEAETGESFFQSVVSFLEIEPLLQRHPYDLSGGEQQKAALAKVLLLQPKVLLLDEPTKGLDAHFKQELGKFLQRLVAGGMTIVLVSHDIEFCAEYTSRAGLFFDGNVTSVQSATAFFAGNHFYTTASNRMARQFFPAAVTVADVIEEIQRAEAGKAPAETDGVLQEEGEIRVKRNAVLQEESEIQAQSGSSLPEESQELRESSKVLPKGRLEKELEQQKKISFWHRCYLVSLFFVVPFVIWAGMTFFDDRRYLMVSLVIMLYALLPPLGIFEHSRPKVQRMVVIAVLAALAVAGRTAFFMLPSVKPMAAITIIAGVSLGAESGFLVGALSMLASNMLFGQGPWTPWQMFAMGVIGLFAGVIFYQREGLQKRPYLCIYGFLMVLLCYGVIMNTASLFMASYEPTMQNLKAFLLSGLPVDLVHGASTVVFLLLIGKPVLEKLERVKLKFE